MPSRQTTGCAETTAEGANAVGQLCCPKVSLSVYESSFLIMNWGIVSFTVSANPIVVKEVGFHSDCPLPTSFCDDIASATSTDNVIEKVV